MTVAESVKAFNKMPMNERKEIISLWTAKNLLSGYDYFKENFNPADEDFCDSYEAIKAEIIKRCEKGG